MRNVTYKFALMTLLK